MHGAPSGVPRVNDLRCQVCDPCAARAVCRTKAIVAIDPGEPPFVDGQRCQGCRLCIPACPCRAIRV